VVAATRGLDRGRVTQEAVDNAFGQDLADFVHLQQQAGLDFFSDGLLRWQDIFRPLVQASSELKPGALTRWFDNNAFFRSPVVTSALSEIRVSAAILPERLVPEPRVATLPSPYMFSRAARGTSDRNQLMMELARYVLRPAAEAMVAAGCQVVHLQEPWLAFFGIEPSDWRPLELALACIGETVTAPLVLHVYFGDAGPFLERLRRLPVDALGIDLVETDVASLGANWEIGLLAGCLDGRSSVVESLPGTLELVQRLVQTVGPPRLYLSSNCDLEFLPRAVAEQKVLRLGEVRQQLQQPAPH